MYESIYESVFESVDGYFALSPAMMFHCLKSDIFGGGCPRAGRKETTVKSINGVQLAFAKLVLFAAFVIAFPMPRKW